jgi:hypothetical protein
MYSGAALLMDVYHPVRSNGLGVIVIQGSGWYMPQRYDAPVLKDDEFAVTYGRRFAEVGYTALSSTTGLLRGSDTRLRSRTHSAPSDLSGTIPARMGLMGVVSVLGAPHPGGTSRLSLGPWMVPGIRATLIR